MKGWPFATAVALLAAANVALGWVSRPEAAKARQPLGDLPLRVAERWNGRELGLDSRTLEVLQLSDHVMRVYLPVAERPSARATIGGPGDQQGAPVFLYVGYYDEQRTGATYHSPKNCLPGAGWQITEVGDANLSLAASGRFTANRVVIEREPNRQLVLYWYQDRGRSIASEYSAKLYLVWDAVTRNRTDGAIVRVSTPIIGTPEEAHTHAIRFLEDVWPLVGSRLPS